MSVMDEVFVVAQHLICKYLCETKQTEAIILFCCSVFVYEGWCFLGKKTQWYSNNKQMLVTHTHIQVTVNIYTQLHESCLLLPKIETKQKM